MSATANTPILLSLNAAPSLRSGGKAEDRLSQPLFEQAFSSQLQARRAPPAKAAERVPTAAPAAKTSQNAPATPKVAEKSAPAEPEKPVESTAAPETQSAQTKTQKKTEATDATEAEDAEGTPTADDAVARLLAQLQGLVAAEQDRQPPGAEALNGVTFAQLSDALKALAAQNALGSQQALSTQNGQVAAPDSTADAALAAIGLDQGASLTQLADYLKSLVAASGGKPDPAAATLTEDVLTKLVNPHKSKRDDGGDFASQLADLSAATGDTAGVQDRALQEPLALVASKASQVLAESGEQRLMREAIPGMQGMLLTTASRSPMSRAAEAAAQKADYAVHVPVFAEGWDRAVAQKVVLMVSNQRQEVDMQLNPPHLGPIEVKLRMSEGEASLSFSSAHAPVREALLASMPKLSEMMAESGIHLGQADVHGGAREGRSERQPQQESWHRPMVREDAVADAMPTPAAWHPAWAGGLPGALNLFV